MAAFFPSLLKEQSPFCRMYSIQLAKPPYKAFSATEEGLCLVPVSEAPIPLTLTINFPPSLLPLARNYHSYPTPDQSPEASLLSFTAAEWSLRAVPGHPPLGNVFLKGMDKYWDGNIQRGSEGKAMTGSAAQPLRVYMCYCRIPT